MSYAVLYQLDRVQSSVTFGDQSEAIKFRDTVNSIGAARALAAFDIAPVASKGGGKKPTGPTVGEWVDRYIESRSGCAKATLYDYRSYLEHDIKPVLGAIPVDVLAGADVAAWVDGMAKAGAAGGTIANKHGLLSAALNVAVAEGIIPSNPAAGTRLPRTEVAEAVFLTAEEYQQLRAGFTEPWWPLLDFLVTSGVRFGEAAGLRPADVDRQRGTVSIARAFKRTYERGENYYQLGPTKTARSTRTLSVAADVLDGLDYSREWLFTNTRGGHLRGTTFRANVWVKSVARAQAAGLKKTPRIHDLRHTCASWMIAANVPLPVIQRHLGHESITTTINRYGHLDRRDSDAAAVALAATLRKPVDASTD